MNEKLSIEGKLFEKCRRAFDVCMENALREMLKVGSNEGTLTLKVDFKLETGEFRGREMQQPRIGYQVSLNVPHKGRLEGMLEEDTFLRRDGSGFSVFSVADQMNMFEEG